MIKKFFAIAILSMAMASCGYSVDGVISDINDCDNPEQIGKLKEKYDSEGFEKWYNEQSEEDQDKIDEALRAKTRELAGKVSKAVKADYGDDED